ncbi:MAG: hypothetical protein JJ974_01055 [Phycisphaerales bacterium]|nr:hypothetical protein [Phycisphaerales bacterium]
MASSFKGLNLFGSGGHRFVNRRRGRRVVSNASAQGDPVVPGTFESGDWEVWVEVRGRLVAGSDSSLWVLRDAILAQAAFGVSEGTLIDEHGHQWVDMKLLSYEETGPTQRGRDVSVGYVVVFGQLSGVL